jgi:sulfopyruvate decarboxylase alpha subunit
MNGSGDAPKRLHTKLGEQEKMISAQDFWTVLKEKGFYFFSGVPCSLLTAVLREVERDPKVIYIPAVRENVALGIASGAYLGGRKSGILMQNSGLGNVINALTSFNLIYKVPVLLVVTWRGYQGKDAPEHLIMGKTMLALLREIEVPFFVLDAPIEEQVDKAVQVMDRERIPACLILRSGVVAD